MRAVTVTSDKVSACVRVYGDAGVQVSVKITKPHTSTLQGRSRHTKITLEDAHSADIVTISRQGALKKGKPPLSDPPTAGINC